MADRGPSGQRRAGAAAVIPVAFSFGDVADNAFERFRLWRIAGRQVNAERARPR